MAPLFRTWIPDIEWMAIVFAALCMRATTKESKDYCQAEYFSASCAPDHVIIMNSATFGRMRLGRCVKSDYGHLGCFADVLQYMDSKCSGKRQCEFQIFTSLLRQMSPCPEELASYLSASYSCLKVTTSQGECGRAKSLKLTEPRGFISSMVAEERNYGTRDCPWHIQASAGQTISLSMLKYAKPLDRSTPDGSCYEMATVSEGSRGSKTISTCDADIQASRLYESSGDELQIEVVGSANLATLGRFIIEYRVNGCSDIKAPVNATWRREGQELVVRCNNTDRVWYLVCQANEWRGELGNCSQEESPKGIGQILRDSILIVVAIGVALGIFCGGLLLTCAYMYMKRRRRSNRSTSSHAGHETDERFIIPEENFPPPPEDFLQHHHQLTSYTDVHLKGHEECFLHTPCTDTDKQISLVYTKTKTLKPGTGTIHGRHVYETPKFV